uniref:Uncharacterized protein n=1 Tax=Peromyscus maniculatus bairdii TaxID=230844 RepID=A0A8C8W3K5_PERMB
MAASPQRPPPLTLTSVWPGFYKDENRRLWTVASLHFRAIHLTSSRLVFSMTVTLWQFGSSLQECLNPFSYTMTCLPTMWQKQSVMLYKGTDSKFWKLVEHIKVRVWYLMVKAALNEVSGGK